MKCIGHRCPKCHRWYEFINSSTCTGVVEDECRQCKVQDRPDAYSNWRYLADPFDAMVREVQYASESR